MEKIKEKINAANFSLDMNTKKGQNLRRFVNNNEEVIIVALYKEGKTLKQIGAYLSLSYEAIRKVLQKYGVERRKRGYWLRDYIQKKYNFVDIENFEKTEYIGVYSKDNKFYAIWESSSGRYFILGESENVLECAKIYNERAKKSKKHILINII